MAENKNIDNELEITEGEALYITLTDENGEELFITLDDEDEFEKVANYFDELFDSEVDYDA